jgi:hypothetical protein
VVDQVALGLLQPPLLVLDAQKKQSLVSVPVALEQGS